MILAKFDIVPSTIKKKNIFSRRNASHQRGMLLLGYLYGLCVCVCRYIKLLYKLPRNMLGKHIDSLHEAVLVDTIIKFLKPSIHMWQELFH